MIYSLFVFIILYIFVLSFASISANNIRHKKQKWNTSTILLLLTFSFIIGLRWDVGMDYMTYYNLCVGNFIYDSQIERIELIPQMLFIICNKLYLPYYIWFIIMAFLQIYFIVKASFKGYVKYLPTCIFFFMVLFLGYNMNIIRQGVAYSIVFYAISFISEEQKKKYFYYIILASLFHKSALILLPFGFLQYKGININRFIQLIIYLSSTFSGIYIVDIIISQVEPIIKIIWGEDKYDRMLGNELENQVNSGYGVLFIDLLCIIIILFSKQILRLHENIKPYYWLFFIGACLFHPTMRLQYFLRINLYFFINIILLIAIVIKDIKNPIINFIIYFLSICMIIVTAISSNWSFVWDRIF